MIVVDNASTDGTVESIETDFPSVILKKNYQNCGFAGGNNQAFKISAGKYILLLGSDTVIIDDSIQKMVDFLDYSPAVGAVSCRLLNPDRTPQRSCRRFPRLIDGILTYLSLDGLASRYNMKGFDFYSTMEVEQPAATCLMLRREVPGREQLFDERFSILYNDVELCRRIWNQGWRIMYLADAEIIHHGSRSTSQAHPELRLEMYRNILLYYAESVGWYARWILLPILILRLLVVSRSMKAFRLFRSHEKAGVVT